MKLSSWNLGRRFVDHKFGNTLEVDLRGINEVTSEATILNLYPDKVRFFGLNSLGKQIDLRLVYEGEIGDDQSGLAKNIPLL